MTAIIRLLPLFKQTFHFHTAGLRTVSARFYTPFRAACRFSVFFVSRFWCASFTRATRGAWSRVDPGATTATALRPVSRFRIWSRGYTRADTRGLRAMLHVLAPGRLVMGSCTAGCAPHRVSFQDWVCACAPHAASHIGIGTAHGFLSGGERRRG